MLDGESAHPVAAEPITLGARDPKMIKLADQIVEHDAAVAVRSLTVADVRAAVLAPDRIDGGIFGGFFPLHHLVHRHRVQLLGYLRLAPGLRQGRQFSERIESIATGIATELR